MANRWFLTLLASVAICSAACSHALSPADGGLGDGSMVLDGGLDAGVCYSRGEVCDLTAPCCTIGDICDPNLGVCAPQPMLDGGVLDGSSDAGDVVLPPDDGVSWQEESVTADVVGLGSVTVASPGIQLATGTRPGVGELVVRSPDAGWKPVPGVPDAAALFSVWADDGGQVFVTGSTDGGVGLLIAGDIDGGWSTRDLDGGPAFSSLDGVVGVGPGEVIAVGTPGLSAPVVALHLTPDGGVSPEPLPPELARAYRLAGGTGDGTVFALAISTDATLPPWVLERQNGTWTELPEIFGAQNLADLAYITGGDLVVVGDDGNGHGLAYAWMSGGFHALPGLPSVPPFTAVCEPAPGVLYLASQVSGAAVLLRLEETPAGGTWSSEIVPSDAARINAMASDSAGDVYAVGLRSCAGCAGYPLVLRRSP